MPQSYKSAVDPNYRLNQINRLGGKLSGFFQLRDQKKREEEERAMRRVQMAMEGVAQGGDPNHQAVESALADLEEIDKDTAEVLRQTLESLSRPRVDPGEVAYRQLTGLAEKARQDAMQEGVGVLQPGAYQESRQAAASAPAGRYLDKARSQMPIPDRLEATGFAKGQKIPLPTEQVDPSKLPAAMRGLGATGGTPEEMQEAARVGAGIALSPAQKLLEEHREKVRKRQEESLDLARERETRQGQADVKKEARMATRLERDMKSDLTDVLWRSSLEERREYQSAVSSGVEPGAKPPTILKNHATKIADVAINEVSTGRLTESEATDLALALYQAMATLMQEHDLSANEALKTALSAVE